MKRNQDKKERSKGVNTFVENSINDDQIFHFLDKIHSFNSTLTSCETFTCIFDLVAVFFTEIGYDSVYLFKSKKKNNNYALIKQYNADYEKLKPIDFEAIHSKLNIENSGFLVSLEDFDQKTFLYGYSLLINNLDTYTFYVIGSEQRLAEKTYGKLIALIGSLIKNQISRIEEQLEVQKVKKNLEHLINKKSSDLDRVVETLSQQYSELKFQHDKRVELIKEIHHRVNNNLQVISSLLSLYIASSNQKERIALEDVRDRVQVMALIHLNVYKSVEMNLIDYKSYLRDLFSYLRSVNTKVKLFSKIDTNVAAIKLDTLVPLGLLITEVVDFWSKKAKANNLDELVLDITITKDVQSNVQQLTIRDEHNKDLLNKFSEFDQQEQISTILFSALTEQLDAEFDVRFTDSNEFRFSFVD